MPQLFWNIKLERARARAAFRVSCVTMETKHLKKIGNVKKLNIKYVLCTLLIAEQLMCRSISGFDSTNFFFSLFFVACCRSAYADLVIWALPSIVYYMPIQCLLQPDGLCFACSGWLAALLLLPYSHIAPSFLHLANTLNRLLHIAEWIKTNFAPFFSKNKKIEI